MPDSFRTVEAIINKTKSRELTWSSLDGDMGYFVSSFLDEAQTIRVGFYGGAIPNVWVERGRVDSDVFIANQVEQVTASANQLADFHELLRSLDQAIKVTSEEVTSDLRDKLDWELGLL